MLAEAALTTQIPHDQESMMLGRHGLNSWSLQFQTPTMPMLLDQLKPEHRAALESVRAWLSTHLDIRPKLDYSGIAWHWNERYELTPPVGGSLRCVCIIPDPELPRVAISCDRQFFDAHPLSSIPKTLHAGLGDGICVGPLAWCTWAISSADLAPAITDLLEQMLGD